MDISGVSAIVTGAGSGMGFAAAAALAGQGARVVLAGRRADLLRARADEIGGLAVPCDVSDEDSVERMFDQATAAHGPARLLVHSAADVRLFTLLTKDARPVSGKTIRAMIETNVLGTIYVARGFATRIVHTEPDAGGLRGLLVNVSSAGAADGVPGSTYCASKGAVDGLTLSLAREFGLWGMRVMTVAPGGIATELFESVGAARMHAMMRTNVPGLRRAGYPDEFARLVLHLCENDYMNGTIIRLDGGMRVPYTADISE